VQNHVNQTEQQGKWTYSAINSLLWKGIFSRRTTDLEKTAKSAEYLSCFRQSQAETRSFVRVTSGRTIKYPFYDAMHRKNRLHKRATQIHPPEVPQKPNFIVILNACTWISIQIVLKWIRIVRYKKFTTPTSKDVQTTYLTHIWCAWLIDEIEAHSHPTQW